LAAAATTVFLRGFQVTAEARPVLCTWHFGDGTTVPEAEAARRR
jgi:hypothetical protein